MIERVVTHWEGIVPLLLIGLFYLFVFSARAVTGCTVRGRLACQGFIAEPSARTARTARCLSLVQAD